MRVVLSLLSFMRSTRYESGTSSDSIHLQVIRLTGFVFEMQLCKLFAGGSECLKVRGKRDTGQLTFQIIGELFPIAGMVKKPIHVIENIPLCDAPDYGNGLGTVSVTSRRCFHAGLCRLCCR